MSYLTRAIGAARLAAKAHAPTIMVVSGVVSMGASVIIASKKTLQVERVLEPHTEKLENIQSSHTNDILTDQEASRKRGQVYGTAAVDLGRLYFVPGVLFVGGAGLVFGGHHIMIKRNATLAIAFTGVQKAFEAYRARVREEFGDTVDRGMLAGYTITEVTNAEGETARLANFDWDAAVTGDPYNRIFDKESSTQWVDDLGVNKLFISNQQRMANIKLGLQGHLYLNDVYEALGFEKNDIGQVCGWKVNYLPDGSKDIPFVDFGIDTVLPDDWKYNDKNAIYLDINCQGLIVGGKIQKELEKR